ncbi:MAG TPA: hypothetical protein ENN73_06680 [Firmicutes bacterium]|nr:hypothetical protein [Bacillota bacterium]
MKDKIILLFMFFCALTSFPSPARETVNVFLDSHVAIDVDYIKTKIPFVNYVNDKDNADVHLLISARITSSNGVEYSMKFIGYNEHEGLEYNIIYCSNPLDSEAIVREALVEELKKGLFPFLLEYEIISGLNIEYREKIERPKKDPWNFWVFNISINGYISGTESTGYSNFWTAAAVSRTTEKNKFRAAFSYSKSENHYNLDQLNNYKTVSRFRDFNSYYVYSLSDHWSIGGNWGLFTSTYSNIKLEGFVVPAIEYNIFPYSESSFRELSFKYRIFFKHSKYFEETIYDKKTDDFTGQGIEVFYSVKQTWGGIYLFLSAKHYFENFDFNNVSLSPAINIKIFKGLSLSIDGNFTMVHDQYFISKKDVTEEDILLQRKELKTQYNYRLGLGFNYTFGSIYRNVVNTRF